ncbi:hypothetical protein [Pedobacter sp. MR2016-24]|nr:hypothetical protein [Pedobacter sp. MR2016-24]MCX2484016.1 hypothetical protein [Pedobacter sp. MR2016-24]
MKDKNSRSYFHTRAGKLLAGQNFLELTEKAVNGSQKLVVIMN